IRTCKHLFRKKMHLIGIFINTVIFQCDSQTDPSNHNSQTRPRPRPVVEKPSKAAEISLQRPGSWRAKNIKPDQNDSKKASMPRTGIPTSAPIQIKSV
ncbi:MULTISPECIES: hypothetical protein, partial [unclassified Thalassospira]